MLGTLARLVDEATAAFEDFDYARALERTEAFFWRFCDDHLELVKTRAYDSADPAGRDSAVAALEVGLNTLQRLFAPFLPFTCEEAWSWWMEGSVHRAPWPVSDELWELAGGKAESDRAHATVTAAATVLSEVRRAKSEAKVSMKTPVTQVLVTAPPELLDVLGPVADDLKAASCAAECTLGPGTGTIAVTTQLSTEQSGNPAA